MTMTTMAPIVAMMMLVRSRPDAPVAQLLGEEAADDGTDDPEHDHLDQPEAASDEKRGDRPGDQPEHDPAEQSHRGNLRFGC